MKRSQYGFTLLEVLIALVIMAIGVIGVAALQITTSMYAESSLHRSQAAMLSREIIERMRQNVATAKAGGYDITTLPTLTQDCEGQSVNCSAAEMKDHDLRLWSARVASMLPSGDATISTDTSVDPRVITITLLWDQNRGRLVDESDDVVLVSQAFVYQLFGLDR